jgi:hypothetical protein
VPIGKPPVPPATEAQTESKPEPTETDLRVRPAVRRRGAMTRRCVSQSVLMPMLTG